jgi:ABC-2 type transport system permease protein
MITMFLVPLIVGLFSSAVFGGGDGGINLPVVLVNQDTGAYGEAIGDILEQIEEIDLLELDAPGAAEERVKSGERLAAVIIPLAFTQDINDHEQTVVTVIIDPAQASYANILTSIVDEIAGALAIQGEIRYGIQEVLADMGYDEARNPELTRAAQAQVEGVLFTQMQQMQSDNPIMVTSETLKGDQVFVWDNVFSVILPAFTVMFAFFVVPALSTELLKEKEQGSLRRLVAAPLSRGSLIGGKVLASTLLVFIQVSLIFGIGAIILDMPIGKSPMAMLLVTISLGLAATTMGLLVAATARSVDQAGSIGLLLVFVLGFLSGSFSPTAPLYKGEGFLALLSRLTPQAQAQIAYYTLLLQNGDLADVLPQISYMLGLSLLFFVIAIWRFRYE